MQVDIWWMKKSPIRHRLIRLTRIHETTSPINVTDEVKYSNNINNGNNCNANNKGNKNHKIWTIHDLYKYQVSNKPLCSGLDTEYHKSDSINVMVSPVCSKNKENDDKESSGVGSGSGTKYRVVSTESNRDSSLVSGVGSFMRRGVSVPLLDIHKVHDIDSLPSPTREGFRRLPFREACTLGHGGLRPEWPAPEVVLSTDKVFAHPYETDGYRAVSSYQRKFSGTSFYSSDELSSPTPSNESNISDDVSDGKTSVAVASAPYGRNAHPVLERKMGQPSVSMIPNLLVFPCQEGTNTWRRSCPMPALKSSIGKKSKDPRLRLARDETTCVGVASSVNTKSGVSPFVEMVNSRKQRMMEEPMLDGPVVKRERNEIIGHPASKCAPALSDESTKVYMKPHDPRRFLHGNSSQKRGGNASDQTNNKSSILRQEDQSGSSPHDTAPNTSRQLIKSLTDINNIMSVSQVSHHGKADKEPVSDFGKKRNSAILASEDVVGQSQPQHIWSAVEHLFDGYDDKQKEAIQKERSRRIEEQRKMFATKKLCLVLDLDHTLLNSAKFGEVDPVHDEILRKKEEQEREKPQRHLFRFPHMSMWTKLRPGIWNFLEKASKLFELHVSTMGNKLYATEMAKLLDPKGELFAGRVISRGDDGDISEGDEMIAKSKNLEGVLGMESSVVIIDDSVRVWPHNKLNLIVVERYIYFPCSRRQFGLPGPSLLEIDHDERPEDGTLASSLSVIERIHQTFFTHQSLEEVDVRIILAAEQRKILAGCRIVFSRMFPVTEANPHLHPLWQTAEQFGAVCTTQIDEQVTHVVANSVGTDKVNWALSNGKFVVHPHWVEASAMLYRRANERDFTI